MSTGGEYPVKRRVVNTSTPYSWSGPVARIAAGGEDLLSSHPVR